AEHDRKQRSTCLPVAMFARQRAAIAGDGVRRVVQEPFPPLDPIRRVQIEVDAAVDTSLAKMPVQRGGVAIFVEQSLQIAEVLPDVLRRDRRILPPRIEIWVMRDL